jgi:2-polyprenyl-3-methyl-5-hydroxy-6-metoxy-1,4-benzoquinol methylase
MQTSDYAEYEKWKSWEEDGFFRVTPVEASYLPGDFGHIDLAGKKFLEMGFGNGTLLAWAQSQGAEVYGTEILDVAIERARKHGIPLLASNLSDNLPQYAGFFDVVAVFDVFEHLTLDQLEACLKAVEALLKPGGRAVFRFPNGQSPFSLHLQYADQTHVQVLSQPIFQHVLGKTSMRILSVTSGANGYTGSWPRRQVQRMKYALRSATQWYLRKIFDLSCLLGTNLVVTVQKP